MWPSPPLCATPLFLFYSSCLCPFCCFCVLKRLSYCVFFYYGVLVMCRCARGRATHKMPQTAPLRGGKELEMGGVERGRMGEGRNVVCCVSLQHSYCSSQLLSERSERCAAIKASPSQTPLCALGAVGRWEGWAGEKAVPLLWLVTCDAHTYTQTQNNNNKRTNVKRKETLWALGCFYCTAYVRVSVSSFKRRQHCELFFFSALCCCACLFSPVFFLCVLYPPRKRRESSKRTRYSDDTTEAPK